MFVVPGAFSGGVLIRDAGNTNRRSEGQEAPLFSRRQLR
jgi:hypothetical protein